MSERILFKMWKKIMIIASIFIITGCSATYNITIDESGINEELNINSKTTDESKQIYNYYLPLEYEIASNLKPDIENEKYDEVEYYDSKIVSINGFNSLRYNHKFTLDSYKKSSIINTCYPDFDYNLYKYNDKEENSYMRIMTLSDPKCFEYYESLENIEINITTNYEVVVNNADSIHNNTYTWNLTPQNIKQIYLIYKIDNKNFEDPNKKEISSPNATVTYFAIVSIFAIIAYIIYKIIKKQSDKNNKLPT